MNGKFDMENYSNPGRQEIILILMAQTGSCFQHANFQSKQRGVIYATDLHYHTTEYDRLSLRRD